MRGAGWPGLVGKVGRTASNLYANSLVAGTLACILLFNAPETNKPPRVSSAITPVHGVNQFLPLAGRLFMVCAKECCAERNAADLGPMENY